MLSERSGNVAYPPSLRLLVSVALAACVAGCLAGAVFGSARPPIRSFQSSHALACSTRGAASERSTLKVTTVSDVVNIERSRRVDVPTAWWEVRSLRASDPPSERELAALNCLFGSPFAPTPEIEVDGDTATLWLSDNQEPTGNSSCLGDLTADLRYRKVVVEFETCGDFRSRFTRSVVEVHAADARSVTPLPTSEKDGTLAWRWTVPSKQPTDLRVTIDLPLATYLTTYTQGPGLDVGDLTIRQSTMASFSADLLLAMVVAAVISLRGRRRLAVVLAVGAAFLFASMGVDWFQPPGFDFSRAVLPAATVLALILAVNRSRPVITAVGGAVAVGALVLGWRHSGSADLTTWAATTAYVLAIVSVTLLLIGHLWNGAGGDSPLLGASIWPGLRVGLGWLLLSLVAFATSFAATSSAMARNPQDLLYFLGTALPFLVAPVGLIALALIGFQIAADRWDPTKLTATSAATLGLVLGLVASPGIVWLWGWGLPVGALALVVVLITFSRHARAGALLHRRVPPEALDSDAHLARSLFDHGPHDSWMENARAMVRLGALVSIVPVGYLAWSLLDDAPQRVKTPPGAVSLVAAFLREETRWLAIAASFGLLYRFLPGRGAPQKALALSSLWFAAAGLTEMVQRWTGGPDGRSWIFPALQILVFLTTVGLLYDHATIRAAGGTWTQLQAAYGVERARPFLAAVLPVALAALAIIQQVATGSGLDFVTGVLSNVPIPPALPG